jgi:phosphohistidine phosphatase
MESSAKPTATQRRLILIRHAKAVEEDVGGDHARSLSERGRGDAAELGEWLSAQELTPELALCSSASRTRETLAALGRNIPTILSDKLYLASTNDMLAQIQATDDEVSTLMLVGHNPGAHGLAAALVSDYAHDDDADKLMLKFPTAACAVMHFDVASWKDVLPETATLATLRY